MNTLEMVSHETMVFMRGKYRLDEIGDGKDELKFKQGKKTILTIYIHEDKYTFLIILVKRNEKYLNYKERIFLNTYVITMITLKHFMMENGCLLM